MSAIPREGPTAVRVRGGSHGGDGLTMVRQDDPVEGRGGERPVAVRPRSGSYGGEKLTRRSVTIPDLHAAAAGAGLKPNVATVSAGPRPDAATAAGAGAPHRPPAAAIPDLVGPGPPDGAEEAEEGGHYSGLFKEYAKERQQQGRAARAPIGGKRQPRIWIRSRSDSSAKPTTTPGACGRSAGGRHGAGFGRSSSNSSGGVGGDSNGTRSGATTDNTASMVPRPPANVNSFESSKGSGKSGSFLLFDPERRANTAVHSQESLKEKQPNKKVTPPHKPPAAANGGGGGGGGAAAPRPRPAPTSPATSASPCSVATSSTVASAASTAAPSSAATSTAAVATVPAPSSSSAPPGDLNSNPGIQGIQEIDQGDAKAGHRSSRLDAAEVSAAAAQLEMDASCPSLSMVGESKAVTDHARHSGVAAGQQSATTTRGREERIAPPPIAAASAPQSLRGRCAATCLGDRSEAHETVIRLDPCAISSTPLFTCWKPRCKE